MHVISGRNEWQCETVPWTDKRLARITSLCLYAPSGT
ncbi:hypothetical protein AMOR_47430 [Anaeromyxobacter oryzae]|uniref:Transposase n=1 Tax=Anaeromyxobacter oryzae TaxID=2918170 RepID=A0ABM7X1S4_9BACT|nr:hypothetical protein AMOR_47430 [Anaeromyxobacter oryzae]